MVLPSDPGIIPLLGICPNKIIREVQREMPKIYVHSSIPGMVFRKKYKWPLLNTMGRWLSKLDTVVFCSHYKWSFGPLPFSSLPDKLCLETIRFS